MILDIPIANNPYQVHIGAGLLDQAGNIINKRWGRKAVVITDTKVEKLYLKKLIDSLSASGMDAVAFPVPEGEKSKNPYQLLELYDKLVDAGIERKDVVIALGGGVVGDLAGFLAATYLRGVAFLQIPTTLLAQVDSSIGGKVAVDLEKGKNLIGTFYQPQLVIADTDTLKTLEPRQLSAGMAEVIKYACIKDTLLFDRLCCLNSIEEIWPIIDAVIVKSLKVKRDYVLRDPLDKGPRMELNFGHTLGHALEAALGYEKLLHGEGVAIGMVNAAVLGERLGITKNGTSEQLKALLCKMGLPTKIPEDTNKDMVLKAVFRDKKVSSGAVKMVLIKDFGKAIVRSLDKKEIESFIMEISS